MTIPMQKTVWAESDGRISPQVCSGRLNAGAVIENPLAHLTDQELEEDVKQFAQNHLPFVGYENILRAARVAKDIRLYDSVARNPDFDVKNRLPVNLTDKEKYALRRERDAAFSEKGMGIVIATVSLAALLQGFVQSSFNGASLYSKEWGLASTGTGRGMSTDDWRLGVANASPWFFAALLGCPLSLPINYWYGRRGGIRVAAFLILGSSIAAIFATNWLQLFAVRIFNGIGMGIKAVSTTILVSETAIGFWRGSAILAWQLWVAFGIMMGFAFNLIFTTARTDRTTLALIQGAPIVPALALLIMASCLCPESPRYHLMRGPNYGVEKAYRALQRVRNTELQALRDLYVVYKAVERENVGVGDLDANAVLSPGLLWVTRDFFKQFKQLFQQRRLYNAMISTSTVNLAQQLCGVNVCAFYSGTLFKSVGAESTRISMAYSVGFGAINFLFALPAIKSIDTLGRRKWLNATLPFMALFMLGGAMASYIQDKDKRTGVTASFMFLFAIAYSPGLGPIPFTLASESFPLTHREAGTAWAISINLFFAGLLAICFPSIYSALGQGGSLGLFSALNIVALILVFLFVEETKRRSLEELDHIFAVSKREFMRFQITKYLPWLVKRYVLMADVATPELYHDMVWGSDEAHEMLRRPDSLGSTTSWLTTAGRHSRTVEQQPSPAAVENVPKAWPSATDHAAQAVDIESERALYPKAPLASHPSRYCR